MSEGNAYSDDELLALICSGNRRAFDMLYERYWELLFGIAYNRLRDVESSEDIVHDIFLSLWHNKEHVRIDSLKSYLAASVKYMVLAHIKRNSYLRRYQNEAILLPPREPSAENAIHYRRILDMVQEEVNRLPEKCRVIFRCSRDLGMSSKEIANKLHLSPKTVDNQINKALHHLREKVKHLSFFFWL